jgi:hypothetical protein
MKSSLVDCHLLGDTGASQNENETKLKATSALALLSVRAVLAIAKRQTLAENARTTAANLTRPLTS